MTIIPSVQPVFSAVLPAIERVLCPIDFSEFSASAYAYARSLADHYHAALVVQNVVEMHQHPCGYYSTSAELFEDFRQKLMRGARSELQKFIDSGGGAPPECVVQEGRAADAILSLARERAIGLIVMGTHGRRGLDRLTLGSVAERVLRRASCPVLAIRQAAPDSSRLNAAGDRVHIHKILCCVDFSAHSERALEYALSLAEVYQAEVMALHVLDQASHPLDVRRDAGHDAGKDTTAAMHKLEQLMPPAPRLSVEIHPVVRLGTAYREILQFASEQQPDLIVTGVRGRNALDLAVFGSTTYRAIQLGSCPVLAVPL